MRLDEAAVAKGGAHLAGLASQFCILGFFVESGGWMRGSVREV